MKLIFDKYQGTGNDFVILDNRNGLYSSLTEAQVRFICDRRFGIGADGLMMLQAKQDYDFEMKYFNADGREGSMCGNGGRCMVQYARDKKVVDEAAMFMATDGVHEARINSDGTISLQMKNVSEVIHLHGDHVLNTGSPHYVKIVPDVMSMDVVEEGKSIRYSEAFKEVGINVNFVEQLEDDDAIFVRTYERGVENETFSCGTGVTACALICHHNDNGYNEVRIKTLGGNLSVGYDRNIDDTYHNIWLTGPATYVFSGSIEL